MNFKLLGRGIAEKNKIKKPLWYTSSLARKPLASKDLWYIVGLPEYMYNTKPEYAFPHNFCSRFRTRLIFPTCVFVRETRKKSWETLFNDFVECPSRQITKIAIKDDRRLQPA